jgi:hypothetical protein
MRAPIITMFFFMSVTPTKQSRENRNSAAPAAIRPPVSGIAPLQEGAGGAKNIVIEASVLCFFL